MDSLSPSSSSSQPMEGCHEEWPSLSSQENQEVIDQLKFEAAHAQWHSLIYRTALLSVEGGLEALEWHLNAVKMHQRPLCGECEKDELIRKLAAATVTEASPQVASPVLCHDIKKQKGRVKRRSRST